MELYLLVMSKGIPVEVSPTQLPMHELNKDNNRHAKVNVRKARASQPYTENDKQERHAENGRNSLLWKKSIPTSYPIPMVSLKPNTQVTLYRLRRLNTFICVYVCVSVFVCAYVITIRERE